MDISRGKRISKKLFLSNLIISKFGGVVLDKSYYGSNEYCLQDVKADDVVKFDLYICATSALISRKLHVFCESFICFFALFYSFGSNFSSHHNFGSDFDGDSFCLRILQRVARDRSWENLLISHHGTSHYLFMPASSSVSSMGQHGLSHRCNDFTSNWISADISVDELLEF